MTSNANLLWDLANFWKNKNTTGKIKQSESEQNPKIYKENVCSSGASLKKEFLIIKVQDFIV